MTTAFKIPQTPQVALYSSIGGTDTSIRLIPSPKDLDGNVLTMDAFGTYGTGTIDPKVAGSEEIVGFTNLIDNGDDTSTITGVTRDLQSVYPYTGTGVGKTHGSSATFVFGINPQTLSQFPSRNNDETINAQWSFPTPTSPQAAVNKAYADALAFNGAGPASVSSFGLVKISTTPGTLLAVPTITIASPAVVTSASHGLLAGDMVKFGTSGALPTGIVAGTTYFVVATVTTSTFEISATSGGTPIVTTGSQSGVHTLTKVTPTAISDTDPRIPTSGQAAALPGVIGTPSNTNRYFTQESATQSGTDQTQTTQNATVDFGTASTAGLHNRIAQSFVPTRTKIRGVKLYKSSDSGTFPGTVSVSLQADVAGAPSGSSLASGTAPTWSAIPNGEFEIDFGTEYDTLAIGSTYWIVLSSSTADTSNHPNVGTNSAGGYANGAVKYNNAIDGWVLIATIDLYFKTLEGNASQLVETDSSGFVPLALLGNRGGTHVTQGSGTVPTNGSNLTITHNLGLIPKLIKVTAFNGNNGSPVGATSAISYGIATIDAAGTPTYHNASWGGFPAASSSGYDIGSATDKIMKFSTNNSQILSATIVAVTANSFLLSFSGTTGGGTNWSYVIETSC